MSLKNYPSLHGYFSCKETHTALFLWFHRLLWGLCRLAILGVEWTGLQSVCWGRERSDMPLGMLFPSQQQTTLCSLISCQLSTLPDGLEKYFLVAPLSPCPCHSVFFLPSPPLLLFSSSPPTLVRNLHHHTEAAGECFLPAKQNMQKNTPNPPSPTIVSERCATALKEKD